jgi:CRISPR-associated protein Cmr5
MAQTIQQQRAAFALERVKHLAQTLKDDESKEFVSYASGLPAMIHMNGLGQAMAFCKVKGKDRKSYDQLYQLVSDWLCKPGQPYAGKEHVLDGITQADMADYQLAQAEALVLMSWVKKFAKAFLAEDAT